MSEKWTTFVLKCMLFLVVILPAALPVSFQSHRVHQASTFTNISEHNSETRVLSLNIQYAYANSSPEAVGNEANFANYGPCPRPADGAWFFTRVAVAIANLPCHLMVFVIRDVIYSLTAAIAILAASIFDYMLDYTIKASTYRVQWIETGWGILRDLANIFFIIGLIYAAISIMVSKFSAGRLANGKRLLATIIIAALLVNFSYFFAGVVIDAAHILARVFHNSITADFNEPDDGLVAWYIQSKDYTPVSVAILDKVDPQNIFNSVQLNTDEQQTITVRDWIVLYGIGIAINVILIGTFISVGILLLGRTIALMVSLVLSPLAFASLAIPPLSKKPLIGFQSWVKDLASNSFMVPVFLFFLYLIVLFTNSMFDEIANTVQGNALGSTEKFLDSLLAIVVPMFFIVGLLLAAKNTAKSMAGEIAKQVAGGISKAAGVVAGAALTVGAVAATGGAALAVRGAGTAAGAAARTKVGKRVLGKKASARIRATSQLAADKISRSSGDFRNTRMGQAFAGQFQNLSGVSLGSGNRFTWSGLNSKVAGVYQDYVKREQDIATFDLDKDREKTQTKRDLAEAQRDRALTEGDTFETKRAETERNLETEKGKLADAQKELKRLRDDYKTMDPKSTAGKDQRQAISDQDKYVVKPLESAVKKLEESLTNDSFMGFAHAADQKKVSELETNLNTAIRGSAATVDQKQLREEVSERSNLLQQQSDLQRANDLNRKGRGMDRAEREEFNQLANKHGFNAESQNEITRKLGTAITDVGAKLATNQGKINTTTATDASVRASVDSFLTQIQAEKDVISTKLRDKFNFGDNEKGRNDRRSYQFAAAKQQIAIHERELKKLDRQILAERRAVVGKELEVMQKGFKDIGRDIRDAITGNVRGIAGLTAAGATASGALVGGLASTAMGGGLAAGAAISALTISQLRPLMFKATRALGVDPVEYKKSLRASLKNDAA